MHHRSLIALRLLAASGALMVGACGEPEPRRTETVSVVTQPTPLPRPVTSLGTLVGVETAPTVKAQVQYLTLNGLRSGVDEIEAEKDKVFLVIRFEGKPAAAKKKESGVVELSSGGDGRLQANDRSETGEAKVFLTDASGSKYTEWSSHWTGDKGHIAFEVPSSAKGFRLHDGSRGYFLAPFMRDQPPGGR